MTQDHKPHMTLPNGDRIYEGGYGRTRDGRKVGPMDYNRADCHFYSGGSHYASNGECCYLGEHGRLAYPHLDLIAEWTDEPEAPDLTAITTPFGLLPPETQQALRDHGGPYEMYQREGWWKIEPVWVPQLTYRVKPAPKRETVTIYGAPALGVQWVYTQCEHDTHRITFDLIDGTPDPASIRMEEL